MLSPEGVALELPVSGPAPRILAYAVDLLLVLIVMVLLLALATASSAFIDWVTSWSGELQESIEENPGDPNAVLLGLLPVLMIMILLGALGEILYFVFWESVTDGRSPGKALLGLRVVGPGGAPLDFRSSLIRNALRLVDILPSAYVVGLISTVLSSKGRRLGDHAAGTFVVRTDRVLRAAPITLEDDLEPLPLSRSQLECLGVTELSLARGTLRRIADVSPERRQALLLEAVTTLRRRLGLDESDAEEPVRFLKRVVITAEREARRS
jgi:uncharacterized RDD family membrane protein YckC